jgi:hypothetical protein
VSRNTFQAARTLWRDLSGWRQVVLVLSLAGLAGTVALDFSGDFWVTHPMLAGVLAGALLLSVAALVVEHLVSMSAARRWAGVSAFALEDLGRVAREIWLNLTAVGRRERLART